MRIGIATWYKENYGSILQAYATQIVLKEMGHEPVFLQFDSSGGFFSKLKSRISTLGISRSMRQYSNVMKGRLALRPYKGEFDLRMSALDHFVSNNLNITERVYTRDDYAECLGEADAFLCGSDQIWNPAITCYSPFFWLSFVPSEVPKISYAPSMGMLRLSPDDRRFIVSQLNSFSAASVRESTTAEMLNGLEDLRVHVETVVDPTLIVPKERWQDLSDSSPISQEDGGYAFAYLLRGNSEQRAFCTRLAQSRGLKLVVYPYLEAVPQGADAESWGDVRVFDDTPADFLARIRKASLVITDSFHCTIFSILFHRDFYVLRKTFDTASQTTRIDEILSIAGLGDRILENLDSAPVVDDDFSYAEERIEAHAQPSREYLDRAIRLSERKAVSSDWADALC